TFTGIEGLTGSTGNDTFQFAPGGSITGTADGGTGTGINTLDYSLLTSGVTVNLTTNTGTGAASVLNIQNVTGSPFNDTITGSTLANVINGNGGSDVLSGSSGNDTFVLVAAQTATTTIDGGAGTDSIVATNGTNSWILTSASGGTINGITFSNMETLTGGTG